MRLPPFDLELPPGTLVQTLRRAFAVVMVLVVALGVAGAVGVGVATARVERLSRVLTPAVEANAEALQLMLDAETGVRGYLLTGDPAFLEPYRTAQDDVLAALARAAALGEQAHVSAPYGTEEQAARAWLEEYARPVVDEAGTPPSAARGKELFDAFRTQQVVVAGALGERREEVRADARDYRSAVVPGLAVLTLVGITFVGLITRSTVATVAAPLGRVRGVLERLREGEHDARAPVEGPDEVRDVAVAVNDLADVSDRLRGRQAQLAALTLRTRDAVRVVRDQLGRAAVLATGAQVLAGLVSADRVLVRYLGTEGPAVPDDVPDGWWAADAAAPPVVRPLEPGDVALARQLARAADLVVVPDVAASLPQDAPDRGGASRDDVDRDPGGAEERVAALVRSVAPSAVTGVLVPVAAGGVLSGVAVVAFDRPREVTDAEAQALLRLCDDLGGAVEQSELFEQQLRLVDRLQELDRQKTVFLSNVSHELRTPLTSITGYSEMLLEGDGGELPVRATRMVEVVERNARRLRDLIEDLLTLSRIESGAHRGRAEDVDLVAVTATALTTLEPQARSSDVRLTARLADDVPVVRGDAGQLERVVLNLAGNAVKFTPSGGSVEVVVERHGEGARLTVTDTGIGIPLEEQQNLFERFFRASNAVAGAVPGTGLGLSIVRGVLDAHGGSLTLGSVPGEGTRVDVVLPGASPPAADRASAPGGRG